MMKNNNYLKTLLVSTVATVAVSLILVFGFGLETPYSYQLQFVLDLLLSEVVVILVLRRLRLSSDQGLSKSKALKIAVFSQLIKPVVTYALLCLYIKLHSLNVDTAPTGDAVDDFGNALEGYLLVSVYGMMLKIYMLYYGVYFFLSIIPGVVIGLVCGRKRQQNIPTA